LYFVGLTIRGVSKAIFHLNKVKRRSLVTISGSGFESINHRHFQSIKRIKDRVHYRDQTLLKVGPMDICSGVTIKPARK
jgi:hypothetical protein